MSVRIKRGSVLVYRIFDIAEEIDIPRAEASLQDIKGRETYKVPKYIDRAIIVKSPPVAFGLAPVELELECGNHHAELIGKFATTACSPSSTRSKFPRASPGKI